MSNQNLRNVIISLIVGALCLYLAFRNVGLASFLEALDRFDPVWLIPAIGISLLLQIVRAWRWQVELIPLERISFGKLWVVVSVAYMAINIFPARLGEFVRPWLLSRRSNLTFSQLVGNLALEKTLDLVCLVFYLLLGLATTTAVLPDLVTKGARSSVVVAVVIASLVVLLYSKGEPFFDSWIIRYLPERVGGPLKRFVRAFVDGMLILPNARLLGAAFSLSFFYWFLPILSSWILIQGFGFDLPFNAALIVFIFIGAGTALPNPPGMVVITYASKLALETFGVPEPDALAYGVVVNALQVLTLIAQGLVALPLAGVTLDDLRRHRQGTATR